MTVSRKERDIAMRIICDFHQNRNSGHSIGPLYLSHHGLPKSSNPEHIVEVLRSMGYITYKREPDGKIYQIDLTDSGKCYFEKRADISHEKKVEWIRYIITTAIAIAAIILSGIALAAQLGLIQFPQS